MKGIDHALRGNAHSPALGAASASPHLHPPAKPSSIILIPGLNTSDNGYLVLFDIQGYSRPEIAVPSPCTAGCGNSYMAECAYTYLPSHEKFHHVTLTAEIGSEIKQAFRVVLSDD